MNIKIVGFNRSLGLPLENRINAIVSTFNTTFSNAAQVVSTVHEQGFFIFKNISTKLYDQIVKENKLYVEIVEAEKDQKIHEAFVNEFEKVSTVIERILKTNKIPHKDYCSNGIESIESYINQIRKELVILRNEKKVK